MIYFVGCSYTWGSGLEFEYLSKLGYSTEELNNLIPPKSCLESLDYNASQYRKSKRFANLVAKKVNKNFEVLNLVNGGQNSNIKKILNQAPYRNRHTKPIPELVVVQFTGWNRDVKDEDWEELLSDKEKLNTFIYNNVHGIIDYLNNHNINWIGLPWHNEIGEILREHYPNNHITAHYKGKTYNSIEEVMKHNKLMLSDTLGINDEHPNSEGHQMLAESIVKKIKENNIF